MVSQKTNFHRFSATNLPTRLGDFTTTVYRGDDGSEHVAISVGLTPMSAQEDESAKQIIEANNHVPLVRVHSACFTSEVLGSLKCDCREQLEAAMSAIKQEGRGLVIYLFQEGRGIGLGAKIQAYALQERGRDTVDANTELGFEEDSRTYEAALDILRDFGIKRLRLLTNNPDKVSAINQSGEFEVIRESIEVGLNPINEGYLKTKRDRMGHLLNSLS